jgi:hypothetical protein
MIENVKVSMFKKAHYMLYAFGADYRGGESLG